MSGTPLAFTRLLAAPRERVFAALTEGRHLARWFCDAADSEPREDGQLTLRWTRPGASAEPFVAHWREWSPPERASFEGGHAGYPGGSAGLVRYRLDLAPGGGTLLGIAHETPEGPGHDRFVAGWHDAWPRALDRLEAYLAPDTAAAEPA
jgi:uncharacterized protein YndB with AHSA1/START domain